MQGRVRGRVAPRRRECLLDMGQADEVAGVPCTSSVNSNRIISGRHFPRERSVISRKAMGFWFVQGGFMKEQRLTRLTFPRHLSCDRVNTVQPHVGEALSRCDQWILCCSHIHLN